MSTAKQTAPLIEAIFSLQWGQTTDDGEGNFTIKFDDDESALLPGIFKSRAKDTFPHYKRTNDGLPIEIPHVVRHQFWKSDGVWPCIQLGLGVMTVNFGVNRAEHPEYSWKSFKEACVSALKLLDESHNLGLAGLAVNKVELIYQDGLTLSETETDGEFLSKRADISFGMMGAFLQSELVGNTAENHRIAFSVPLNSPKGILTSELIKGQVSGKNSFIQSVTVRSIGSTLPDITLDSLTLWMESAHTVHKHTYETLISPIHEKKK